MLVGFGTSGTGLVQAEKTSIRVRPISYRGGSVLPKVKLLDGYARDRLKRGEAAEPRSSNSSVRRRLGRRRARR